MSYAWYINTGLDIGVVPNSQQNIVISTNDEPDLPRNDVSLGQYRVNPSSSDSSLTKLASI